MDFLNLADGHVTEKTITLHTAIKHSPLIIWALDTNGTYVQSEGKALNGTSLNPQNVIGKNHFELFADRPDLIENAKRALNGESFKKIVEFQGLTLEVNHAPIIDDGKIIGMVAVSQDITEQTKTKNTLKDRDHQLSIMTEKFSVYLAQVDKEKRYIYASSSHEKLLGRPIDTILGKTVEEVMGTEAYQPSKYFIEQGLSGKKLKFDRPLVDDSGRTVYLSMEVIPEFDEQENVQSCLILAHDISDIKKAEIELAQAIKARDEFMSIASHELKTPLTRLLLQTQLRIKKLQLKGSTHFDPTTLQKNFEYDSEHLRRLAHLVEDMLDISRIQTGRLTIKHSPGTFDDCVKNVLKKNSDLLKNAKCTVDYDSDQNLQVHCDSSRIEQVINTLLMNCMKYAPGKKIEIKVNHDQDYGHISIKDYGPGIDPKDHVRIFQPFERCVSKNEVSGLGIGLYIASKIIEAHKGEINLVSEPEKGAEFKIKLPLNSNLI